MGSDDGVALARGGFDPGPVDNRDPAVRLGDQPGPLQRAGHETHGRAGRAEHEGEALLAQLESIAIDPVVHHRQPSAAPLVDRVQRDADR